MPPRPAISGVQAILSAATTPTWRATASPTLISRYSTAPPANSNNTVPVPPESPNYIKLQEPRQSSEPRLPPIRGHVPVPRDIFTSRDGKKPLRVRGDYVKTIRPKSARELAGKKPRNLQESQRWELADTRRKALAEGLQGLWTRKKTADRVAHNRALAHAKENQAAARRPDRPDEVLTRPTIHAHTLITEVPLDPNRFEDAEKAKAAHDAKMAVKADARRDALCQMYMAAGRFIIDEAELETRVNQVFGADAEESIWRLQSEPPTLAAEATNNFRRFNDLRRFDSDRTLMRQKALAEALTGGKL